MSSMTPDDFDIDYDDFLGMQSVCQSSSTYTALIGTLIVVTFGTLPWLGTMLPTDWTYMQQRAAISSVWSLR